MSFKISHKKKVRAKRYGRHLVRYAIHYVGDPLFSIRPGTGKNRIHTKVIGTVSRGKSGKSIIEQLQQQDLVDGGNRLEKILNS